MTLFPALPLTDGAPLLLLSLAESDVERGLVRSWAITDRLRALDATSARLADALDEDDDLLVLPTTVVWLPRERDGARRVTWTDLVLLRNPRRPQPVTQKWIVQREPERGRLIAGEPATVGALRARWQADDSDTTFTEFVVRQATLALQRAERSLIGDRYKVPRLVAEQIESSLGFQEQVRALSKRIGEPHEEVQKRAVAQLHDLATVQSTLAQDALDVVMSPLHAKAWTVQVDRKKLEELRELNRKTALVFLPSHRSYADPLVLRGVLADNDFPRNHCLGGNNMSFWPIGPIGRRAGIVFIPRTMQGDPAQKLALRAYLSYLVGKRFNLEWYLEGGRSRTGKLRAPRYGLLTYLVEALESGRTDDVQLVPVSISYDQLPEIAGMIAEDGGAKKSPESLSWFAKHVSKHQKLLGTVHVGFGEPLSLREGLASSEDGQLPLHKVAFEVYDRINRATPVLSTSLVILALLGVRDRGLTLREVGGVLDPLLDYAEQRDLPESGLAPLRTPRGLDAALRKLTADGVVTCFDEGTEPVWAIAPGQHNLAAYYRNGCVHWFVNRAIVELAVLQGGSKDEAWAEALRLRDLLKYEFFFSGKEEFREQLGAELELVDPQWRDTWGVQALERSRLLTAHRALRSFLEAYLVVADRLAASDAREALDTDAFLKQCQAVGRQYHLQGRIHSEESISRALFETGLQLAENRGLMKVTDPTLAARRRAFADEITDVLRRIAEIDDLDQTHREDT